MTNVAILAATCLVWWFTGDTSVSYFRAHYRRQLSPAWYFLEGMESGDGKLTFVQSDGPCLAADHGWGTASDFGDLGVEPGDADPSMVATASGWHMERAVRRGFNIRSVWNRLGFFDVWELGYRNPSWQRREVIPYWSIALLLSAWPFVALVRVGIQRSRRAVAAWRTRQGRCPACGYDVRATPGRCPECGAAAEIA